MGDEHRKRKNLFTLRLFDEEIAILDAKADEAGMNKSDFLRNMILFGAAHERTAFSKEDSKALIYELNRIGNNINQLAYLSNASHSVCDGNFEQLINDYFELLSVFENFVRGKNDGDN